MCKALIVSSLGGEQLSELLEGAGISSFTTVTSGGEARRRFSLCDFDLVVINTPLSDETGMELAVNFAENGISGVLLLVRSELVETVQVKTDGTGIGIIGRPLHKAEVQQFIRFMLSNRRRYLGIKEENNKLKNKLEEIKIVDRAKLVLIQNLNLSEADAHRFIEKQAMDMRITRKEMAENILKMYAE